MSTKSDIRTAVKNIVPRQPGNINTLVDAYIDTGVELMGSMIESIFQEEVWRHTFTSAEITSETNNWALPTRTKRIIACALIDTSGTDNLELPLRPASPADKYDMGELYSSRYRPDTFPSSGWRWDLGRRRHRATYDRDGRPESYYRINNNIYIYPRPDTNEENNILEVFLAVKPDLLVNDGDDNVITNNYERSLIHYVAGLLWLSSFNQQQRGQAELQIAGKLMEEFANDDEIQKLLSVPHMNMPGARRY